ncbi:MAG: hypothetical protein CMN78_05540 [Spirochaetales bacterium]|nr:hypothetical protein [Spirochaetales bacterium]
MDIAIEPDKIEIPSHLKITQGKIYDTIDSIGGTGVFDFLSRLTDAGNAERFAYFTRNTCRYCDDYSKWLINDGQRWVIDNRNEILRLAKEVNRSLYSLAGQIRDDSKRTEVASHLIKSESDSRMRAMLHLAQSELPIVPDELDSDRDLFNVANGTIDLITGTLQAHDPNDLITKVANVEFDASATCPAWKRFLAEITDNHTSLQEFLQSSVGYSLTGDTSEQCIFIQYGTGSNGKSTFNGVLTSLFGDYWQQTPVESLLVKNRETIPADLARLKGARLVTAAEVESGRRIAESLIKQMSGGDEITARYLYGEWFSYKPQFKIFIQTNHKPVIRGSDYAIWRRIRLIPFSVTFSPEKQDRHLLHKLEAELAGILNWALEGLERWREKGLEMPDEVRTATNEYRSEMDVLSAFLGDCCNTGNGSMASAKSLYSAYAEWCESTGEYKMSQRAMGTKLRERGFDSIRQRNGVKWLHIGLVD